MRHYKQNLVMDNRAFLNIKVGLLTLKATNGPELKELSQDNGKHQMEEGNGYAQRYYSQEIVRNLAVAFLSILPGAKLLLRIQIQVKPVPYGSDSAVPPDA